MAMQACAGTGRPGTQACRCKPLRSLVTLVTLCMLPEAMTHARHGMLQARLASAYGAALLPTPVVAALAAKRAHLKHARACARVPRGVGPWAAHNTFIVHSP